MGRGRREALRLEWLDPKTLRRNPRNWRRHPDRQRQGLKAALRKVGWAGALLYNERTKRLIDGHLRQEISSESDEPVPVLIGSWSPKQEALILATLDPIGSLAGADTDQLGRLLEAVGAQDGEIQGILDGLRKDYAIQAPCGPRVGDPGPKLGQIRALQAKWGVRRGQIWQVGRHRIMCGDSTKADDVKRLMGRRRAVLFATDPPYLVGYDGMNHPHKWGERPRNKDWTDRYHDWDDPKEGEKLYEGFLKAAIEFAIDKRAAWYCWHASRNQAMVERMWNNYGAFVHQQIIWCKDRPILTRCWYMWQHEPCFFGWVKGNRPRRRAQDHPSSVWVIPTVLPGTKTQHPTSKPVEVFAIPIRQHTTAGELCYEPFAGSGTQHVACQELGRVCFGIEIEPGFVAVTLERLAAMRLKPRLFN